MESEFGLLTRDEESTGQPIPLLGVKAEGEILGRGARVRVLQRFKNEDSKPVEAIYKFPLPEGAAICGFKAHVGDRVIEGKVEERDKAFEIYDKALIEGHGGYLLDQERPNVFTLSVGNLNPGSEVLVEVEYVTLLDGDGAAVRFFLPTIISPRYIPDGAKDDSDIPVDGKLHPPYAGDVPYGLAISLNIHAGRQIKSVESPSHHIKVENMKGDVVNVSFSSGETRMDRDLVLTINYEEAFTSRAYRCRFENEDFLQLDMMLDHGEEPKSATEEAPRDVLFVLDCSGSMQGDSIEQAKRALEICLKGMPQGVCFDICRFGSRHEFLFKKPESYSESTLSKAVSYLHRVDADLGGTEILQPLKAICSNDNECRQDIILLTDGEVGNEQEVCDLIREHRSRTRVFTVGIGAGCNEHFIKGLARAGNGSSELIHPGERIEPKVLSLFGKLGQAGLENASIGWGHHQVEQAPLTPAVFLDTPVTLFARSAAENFTGKEVLVKGKVNGTEMEWKIPIVNAPNDGLPIPTLWARERVRDLEESEEVIGEKGSRQRQRRKESNGKAIIDICKRFGILSQSTSYVAVEEREEKDKTSGEIALRKIPVLVTVGWHGLDRRVSHSSTPIPYSRVCQIESISADMVCEMMIKRDIDSPTFRTVSPCLDNFIEPCEQILDPMDLLMHILSLQKPTGGMMLDEATARMLSLDLNEVHRAASKMTVRLLPQEKWHPVDPLLLISTAILLLVLESHFTKDRSKWAKVVAKSESWLLEIVDNGHPHINGLDFTTYTEQFVRRCVQLPWVK